MGLVKRTRRSSAGGCLVSPDKIIQKGAEPLRSLRGIPDERGRALASMGVPQKTLLRSSLPPFPCPVAAVTLEARSAPAGRNEVVSRDA